MLYNLLALGSWRPDVAADITRRPPPTGELNYLHQTAEEWHRPPSQAFLDQQVNQSKVL
jgi:hypothetical protein